MGDPNTEIATEEFRLENEEMLMDFNTSQQYQKMNKKESKFETFSLLLLKE